MNGFDFYTLARFWSKVSVGRQTECWSWRGGVSDMGYGRFKLAGKLESPHRLAYTMCHGPIRDNGQYHGTVVMHRCDNPRCVNPAHLSLGTQLQNAQDMVAKGRAGKSGGHTKLTDEQVKAIAADPRPLSVAAKAFGISRTHIGRIRKRALEGTL